MDGQRAQLEAVYRRYIQRCNERGFDDLGEFVDPDVEVNGKPHGLQAYAEGLASVIELVPDFHWDLRHLLIDGWWLSAHLTDTGTAATARPVRSRSSRCTGWPAAGSSRSGVTWTGAA